MVAQQSMITVDGDIRVFAVLSAFSAAGGDLGLFSSSFSSTLRDQVRAAVQKDLPPDLQERLAKFIETHPEGDNRNANVAKYVSLALVMGQPPKFGFIWAREKLPPDALAMADFEPLVKEVYEAIHIESLWSNAQPPLENLIARYQAPIMKTIQQTEAYLRLPSSSYLGRHYYIVIDPLGATSGAAARNYGDDYYLVVPPLPQPNLDEIRHQFLHFVFDPLSMRVADRFYHKRALFDLAVNNPNLDAEFKKEFNLFAIECIIRAAELRMKKLPPAKAEDDLTRIAASGFFLIRHFNNQFQEFEKQEQGIRISLGAMVEAIDVDEERKYASSLSLIALPPPAPKKVLTENEKKLNEAEDLLSEEKYELAKKMFKQVAETDDLLRAKALYGLGVACSLQRNREEAKGYFQQALTLQGVDLATMAWCHIYLGRLADLEGDRETAVKEYGAAAQLGEETRGAFAAAKRGMEKPFSGKDRPE
jgi:tetratricopeptide (TPR) repeat protein